MIHGRLIDIDSGYMAEIVGEVTVNDAAGAADVEQGQPCKVLRANEVLADFDDGTRFFERSSLSNTEGFRAE